MTINKLAYFRSESNCNAPLLAIVFVLSGLMSVSAWAGRLHFTDGESISGSLISIKDGTVNWSSPMLGELAIAQQHIASIESAEHFDLKTSGRELTTCWMSIEAKKQQLHCDQGDHTIPSWQLVVELGDAFYQRPILAQKGTIVIAAEDSNGNNNITNYNVAGRSEWRYIESRHIFSLVYQEESAESTSTRNMWRTAYQYDQFFTEQWFAAGSASVGEDKFKDIERRSAIGLGIGYQFLDTKFFDLSGKGTLNYVDEQLTNGVERSNPAFLWSVDLSWRLDGKGTEFFHRHGLLQSLENGADFEMTSYTGFKYPINGHFSSVIQLEYDYDNLPADSSIDKNDEKWSLGLDYSW